MDNQIINNIKTLGIDMINEAGSGHPGIVLGAAPILYTLYAKYLNINVSDPNWLNRDRFIMSSGHGSALLYATLFMAGYLEIEDLKNFRKIHSKTPGHPEYKITPGVEVSTGPLGQGFATAVGMAFASKKLNQELKFPKKNFLETEESLINHKIYVLCSDGDMMEGIVSEAASIAGNLNLNNLIVLYDSNHISLDGSTNLTLKENVLQKFKAMNWNTILVKKGNNIKNIDRAIQKAKNSTKPTIIECRTTIGEGSLLEGTNSVHGGVLTNQDTENIKNKLGLPNTPFYVNNGAREQFTKEIARRSSNAYQIWSKNYNRFMESNLKEKYAFLFQKEPNLNLLNYDFHFDEKEELRKTNQKIMNVIASSLPSFIGGSADLATTTGIYLEKFKDITSSDYTGKNIWFGVREHAMAAILNGLSFYHYQPFGSTFLSFSDYLKPALRLSAMMKLPVTYIFTHDSIQIGQDGPTHQPIEQLSSLRLIPNVTIYRPSDANELIGCWNTILKRKESSCLILARNEVSLLPTSQKQMIEKGAYIIRKEQSHFDAILVASGTEVHTAYHIAYELYQNNQIDLRVVSMVSEELFLNQDESYQEMILPTSAFKILIEASSHEKITFNKVIDVKRFGYSGTKEEVLKEMNFDYESIKNKIFHILK